MTNRESEQLNTSKEEENRRHIAELIRENHRYIVVEGVIGAGKTTLARRLSDRLDAQLVLEGSEHNPFLPSFYTDKKRWAFHAQLSFLASRYKQQKQLTAGSLFHRVIVSDYAFEKDRIFAHVNLEADELQLYETMFSVMERNTSVPDAVIYLQSEPRRLLKNIRKRGRPFEENIDLTYLKILVDAYDHYFFHYSRSPLLIVNTNNVNLVEDEATVDEMLREIATTKYRGTTYFRPASGGLFT